MSGTRLTRSAVGLLALTGTAALSTVGIAVAQAEQHHADQGRSYRAAETSATALPRSDAKGTHSACAGLKSRPPSLTGSVSATGHTVHVTPTGARTGGPAQPKPAPPGTATVSVNGHTVRVIPTGGHCGGSAGQAR